MLPAFSSFSDSCRTDNSLSRFFDNTAYALRSDAFPIPLSARENAFPAAPSFINPPYKRTYEGSANARGTAIAEMAAAKKSFEIIFRKTNFMIPPWPPLYGRRDQLTGRIAGML